MGMKKATAGLLLAAFTAMAGVPAVFAPTVFADELPAPAQVRSTTPSDAIKYSTALHLAYVPSSSPQINEDVRKGMAALKDTLKRKTAVDPAGIVALDIERDELTFFPFIYWPVTQDAQKLSDKAQKNVQHYLKTGGLILFDIHDQNIISNDYDVLGRVLDKVALKPLVPMGKDHVLTRTFYLVPGLPGSQNFNSILVENPGAKKTENISSVIIGKSNWAAAWAGTSLPTYSRERKMALRAGVNMVMFALTGNYKTDQTFIKTILKRLDR